MTPAALQDLCESGQALLMEARYLEAERALSAAEHEAWASRDWETLARLYMPLQEARRQRRQRCGEGLVVLDLLAAGPDDNVDGRRIVDARLDQGHIIGDRPAKAGDQIVDDDHRIARIAQRQHRMAADIAGAAGDEDRGFGH